MPRMGAALSVKENDEFVSIETRSPVVELRVTNHVVFDVVVEEIISHCDSIRGFAATLSEFEARLIAGCAVDRLLHYADL